jgi:hypothetical protein
MHHHNQHQKVRLAAAVMLAILVGLLAFGSRANAQSLDDPPAPATNSSMGAGGASYGTESVTIDEDTPAVADGAAPADPTDDSTAQPASGGSLIEPAPSAGAVASGDASDDGSVLEIPQVVNLQNGNNRNQPADGAVANADGSDDDTAQSSQDGQNDAADDNLATTADQVGTVQDYEDQANETPPGTIFFAPGVAIVRFPPPLFSPLPRPPFGVPMASPIILPPISRGPFPSTSPMLMAPRFGTFGSFPRGGLMRLRR